MSWEEDAVNPRHCDCTHLKWEKRVTRNTGLMLRLLPVLGAACAEQRPRSTQISWPRTSADTDGRCLR